MQENTKEKQVLEAAVSLLRAHGTSAIEIAKSRVSVAQAAGTKEHDHALLVLGELEEILRQSGGNIRRISLGDDGGIAILSEELLEQLDNAKPVKKLSGSDFLSGKRRLF